MIAIILQATKADNFKDRIYLGLAIGAALYCLCYLKSLGET